MSIILITDRSSPHAARELGLPDEVTRVAGFDDSPEIFREADAELVLLDCTTAAEQGVRLLERIKRMRYDLPVIFLAGESSEELVIRAFRAGAREFFKQPVRVAELRSTIQSILNLKRHTAERRLSLQATRNGPAESVAPNHGPLPANILRAVRFIETNISTPLNLDTIARAAALSKFHFSRLFKAYVGMSPKQYTLTLRINRSLALLRNPELTISTVALRAGFNELGEFTRQFRKIIGMTPSAFRNSLRKNGPLLDS